MLNGGCYGAAGGSGRKHVVTQPTQFIPLPHPTMCVPSSVLRGRSECRSVVHLYLRESVMFFCVADDPNCLQLPARRLALIAALSNSLPLACGTRASSTLSVHGTTVCDRSAPLWLSYKPMPISARTICMPTGHAALLRRESPSINPTRYPGPYQW